MGDELRGKACGTGLNEEDAGEVGYRRLVKKMIASEIDFLSGSR